MRYHYSQTLLDDVTASVTEAFQRLGIVNVPVVAEQVRRRHPSENIALEDIEEIVLDTAQMFHIPMEFDGASAIFAAHEAETRLDDLRLPSTTNHRVFWRASF
ncbi:hypothetical protein EN858_21430 [Mesorhizobium sp. M4B.F.Ca.ET.215.01.1.1]|uniref:hypothetical protein n=1 Tax=unclassified Mesorhizobium TaxID=325217 RepID=UPI000FD59B52|nr:MULTISPECIES: hypothetical protein [unclassified Mesorhizobium]RUW25925.1 hypothetical protein EOA34_10045 [Mesorhizobium sp. M4B.F.Ca.ET.013.02.1.1]RWF55711.1 MAG: hypothetical protein EOS47_33745 [Mesorhizobium sp.]TGQ09312.1 hypothetical protein EN858_21430 [Mesorhizobium sp. M4B.F.Ca.ET.215.01.1.1]TGQ27297.1 hypothetical protein EN863_049315 [Mesorhizobium sp. M00.F.Ca.ET.220.01.1.1]TGQ27884.1 hypothetical protein EN857_32415 [Mesorhizobium sp. M4B.F.Ca.ET.214.01.1.1]